MLNLHKPDKELAILLSGGDEQAFRELYNRYWSKIYGLAYSMTKSVQTAEDFVQEIFLKIWMKRDHLDSVKDFDAYLFIVAKNHILNELRKLVYDKKFSDELVEQMKKLNLNPEDQLLDEEARSIIENSVNRLPRQQKTIYLLSREKGLDQKQIAEQLHISTNTVKSHMNKALSSIRHFISLYYHDYLKMGLIVFLIQKF